MYPYRYRLTKVGGLTDLVNVVNSSATVNTTQLVRSPEGTVIVPTYDWQSFLGENLNKLVGIKSFHHLRFSHDHKGPVFVKLKSDSPEVEHKLLKHDWCPTSMELPERVLPSGLSLSRQWYLYNKIREFCPEECKDTTCPKTAVPEPTATTCTRSATSSSSTTTTTTTTATVSTASTAGSTASGTSSVPGAPLTKRPRLWYLQRSRAQFP